MANSKDNISKYATSFIGFEEERGSVLDTVGGYIGTAYNSPTRSVGWNGIGQSMNFNGSSQYIVMNGKIIPLGAISIRFKFKAPKIPTKYEIIMTSVNNSLANGTGQHGIMIALAPVANKRMYIVGANNGWNTMFPELSLSDSVNIFDNNWHDILFTWDGLAGSDVSLYVDDMITPKATVVALTNNDIEHSQNTYIGRTPQSSGTNYFTGSLDNIEIYNRVISAINDKYLILNDNEYKYHDGESWQVTTPTGENFIQFGMEQLSQITETQWQELSGGISVVMWSDFEGKEYINAVLEKDSFTAKDILGEDYGVIVLKDDDEEPQQLMLDAVGKAQTVYPISDISLFGVTEIKSLSVTGIGNGKIAISVDNGTTWNTFSGGSWSSITDISHGMDISTFNTITDSNLRVLLGESKFIRFAYYLSGDAEISNVTMKVSTTGTPEFANNNDYTKTYDQTSKTITYNITKSGSYVINYGDIS